MPKQQFDAQDLARYLDKHKVATLEDLKGALGTNVSMTVFRKLRQLFYRTSYSHSNRYYTLDRIADFDQQGLWSCLSAWFSRYGTLLKTLEHFVGHAQAGHSSRELQAVLHVGVKESLLKLARQGRVVREKISGHFLYCSPDSATRRRQILSRRAKEMEQTPEEARMTDKVKAALVLFLSLLDEQQRRIYAGLEALKVGRGGDRWIAELLELNPATVARGRRELLAGKVVVHRARKSGGGRKAYEKKSQE